VAAVLAIAVLVAFSLRAHQRARIWAVPALVLADAAANYPDGVHGHLLRARRQVESGQPREAVASLRAAYERGFDGFEQLLQGDAFQRLRGHPDFDAVIHDMAGHRIELFEGRPNPTQAELFAIGIAHHARGEIDLARRAFERVLEQPGPLEEHAQRALAGLPPPGGAPDKRQRAPSDG
jgi:tetratricopeptide (TPR) repeat protein